MCGWGWWAESLLLRDESSTWWPSRCLAMHIKTGACINIFPNDLTKWKTITVMIPPWRPWCFLHSKRARSRKRNENTCNGIKVKLFIFLFLNEHHARVTSLIWVSKQTDTFRSAWQMQPLAKFILCRVSRGHGSDACTFSYECGVKLFL